MKQVFSLLTLAMLTACNGTNEPVIHEEHKILLAVVIDYSGSYQKLVSIDSTTVSSLFLAMSKTSGTIVHIPVQSNSSIAPVFTQRIEKLDTANTSGQTNLYQAARLRSRNKQLVSAFMPTLQAHVSAFLTETRKYKPSSYTDLQHSLQLVHSTVTEPIYTNGKHPYKRVVLVLSDMLNDPPQGKRDLSSLDFSGTTALIVRPSPQVSGDSLRSIFSGADLHNFTTIHDAISFINEQ